MNLMHAVHVPAGEGPFPTVFAFHGFGASAHDLFGLAPLLHGGRALVIAPQGPVRVPIQPGHDGWAWFPLAGGREPDPAEVARALEQLRAFVDEATRRYPVDPRRSVLLGFSQGGVMAYDLALREPERWAGLVALSSWLPGPWAAEAAERLRQDPGRRAALAALPVLIVHGTEDPMIPVERGRESRDALRALGNEPTYREFPMGHEIRPEALRELVRWLDQRCFAGGPS